MITLTKKRFLIEKDRILPAFEQVKEHLGKITGSMMEAKTLAKCFAVFGFQTQATPNGDLMITSYQESPQPFEMFFNVLAPFVKKGSYLHFDEEGDVTKLRFDGTELEMEIAL